MITKFQDFTNKIVYDYINEEIINSNLKKYCSIIESNIDDKTEYHFTFSDMSFYLKINFIKNDRVYYSGSVNAPYAIENDYKDFTIKVNVNDIAIDRRRVMSIIMHELKHIFDCKELDNIDDLLIDDLKTRLLIQDKNISLIMKHFFLTAYNISMQHEMNAHQFMVYEYLRRFDFYDKDMMIDTFKKSSIYESIVFLDEFDTKEFIKMYGTCTNQLYYDMKMFFEKVLDEDFDEDKIVEYIYKYELIFKKNYKFI
jgi:hypothetical protein